jgi:hypothetical protein
MLMNKRTLGSVVAMAMAVVVAFLIVLAAPGPISGQPPGGGKGAKQAEPPGPVPRTADGKPDMSGFWGGVNPSAATSIEPANKGGGKGGGKGAPGGGKGAPGGGAPGGDGKDVAAKGGAPGGGKGAPGGGKGGPGGGKAKTLIVDPPTGLVPYTAAARAKSDDIIANRMFLEPELHCYASGVPHNMWVQFGLQAIQTPQYLVLMWEFQHSRRIIPLDGRPHQFPDAVRQFQGETVGHWEGDTLVIETKNQTNRTWFDTSGHYAPRDIHVIERLTMLNSNQIRYEATVTSPSEFTQPMKLEGTINRANANDPSYEQMEFGCIEGNRDIEHYTEDKGGKAKNVGIRVP